MRPPTKALALWPGQFDGLFRGGSGDHIAKKFVVENGISNPILEMAQIRVGMGRLTE
jgi:hypothetical protein